MKKIATRDVVERALRLLREEGKNFTPENLRTAVGGGSYNTLIALRNEILSEQIPPPPDNKQAHEAFDAIWSTAVAQGRTEREEELAEANQTIEQLVAENHKLETEMSAVLDRVQRGEMQRDDLLAQLGAANESVIQARASGEQHAAKLAKALSHITALQKAHAVAMEKLRRKLEAIEVKAHDLELALARAETRLEERTAA
jgi:chromosome segregation ATPase